MNEEINICCNSSNGNFAVSDTSGGDHTESYRDIHSLRDRTVRMLADGVSPIRILREIKNDEYCTGIQKRRILEELHMK